MDWPSLGGGAAAGITMVVPIIGVLLAFHVERGKRFDKSDSATTELKAQITKIDGDLNGLFRQIGAIAHDVEARFLTKDEHTAAINRLDHNMRGLNDTIGTLNTHLFNLARDRHRDDL